MASQEQWDSTGADLRRMYDSLGQGHMLGSLMEFLFEDLGTN